MSHIQDKATKHQKKRAKQVHGDVDADDEYDPTERSLNRKSTGRKKQAEESIIDVDRPIFRRKRVLNDDDDDDDDDTGSSSQQPPRKRHKSKLQPPTHKSKDAPLKARRKLKEESVVQYTPRTLPNQVCQLVANQSFIMSTFYVDPNVDPNDGVYGERPNENVVEDRRYYAYDNENVINVDEEEDDEEPNGVVDEEAEHIIVDGEGVQQIGEEHMDSDKEDEDEDEDEDDGEEVNEAIDIDVRNMDTDKEEMETDGETTETDEEAQRRMCRAHRVK